MDEARTNSHPSLEDRQEWEGGTEWEKANPGKMFPCPPSLSVLGHGEIGLLQAHLEDGNIGVLTERMDRRDPTLGTGVEAHVLVGKAVCRRERTLLGRLPLGFLLPLCIVLYCITLSWGKGFWKGWYSWPGC